MSNVGSSPLICQTLDHLPWSVKRLIISLDRRRNTAVRLLIVKGVFFGLKHWLQPSIFSYILCRNKYVNLSKVFFNRDYFLLESKVLKNMSQFPLKIHFETRSRIQGYATKTFQGLMTGFQSSRTFSLHLRVFVFHISFIVLAGILHIYFVWVWFSSSSLSWYKWSLWIISFFLFYLAKQFRRFVSATNSHKKRRRYQVWAVLFVLNTIPFLAHHRSWRWALCWWGKLRGKLRGRGELIMSMNIWWIMAMTHRMCRRMTHCLHWWMIECWVCRRRRRTWTHKIVNTTTCLFLTDVSIWL